jgi:hypothetical protein
VACCVPLSPRLDSIIWIIADRLHLMLAPLEVKVTTDVHVHGTLVVDQQLPVGFQKMHCRVAIQEASRTDSKMIEELLAAAEYGCVNLHTLRSGVRVKASFHHGDPSQ